jgi:hypothetical protein
MRSTNIVTTRSVQCRSVGLAFESSESLTEVTRLLTIDVEVNSGRLPWTIMRVSDEAETMKRIRSMS